MVFTLKGCSIQPDQYPSLASRMYYKSFHFARTVRLRQCHKSLPAITSNSNWSLWPAYTELPGMFFLPKPFSAEPCSWTMEVRLLQVLPVPLLLGLDWHGVWHGDWHGDWLLVVPQTKMQAIIMLFSFHGGPPWEHRTPCNGSLTGSTGWDLKARPRSSATSGSHWFSTSQQCERNLGQCLHSDYAKNRLFSSQRTMTLSTFANTLPLSTVV